MTALREKKVEEQAFLWKSNRVEGVSLFKAKFHKFEYKMHAHDEFALGVIEKGGQAFTHKGQKHIAPSGSIITVNPGEAHDGKSAKDMGYQYRVAYIQTKVLNDIFQMDSGNTYMPFHFENPVTFDAESARRLLISLHKLETGEVLESQSLFLQSIADIFQRHARPGPAELKIVKDKTVVDTAREYIHSRVTEPVGLKEIAGVVGMSQYHFIRIFKETTGFSPHAYMVQQRVKLAKNFIEQGRSLAESAFLAGFSDQSHMTRHFKSSFGLTPGLYQKQLFPKLSAFPKNSNFIQDEIA